MTATPYPLAWPEHTPRTGEASRAPAKFSTTASAGYKRGLTFHEGLQRVLDELDRVGVDADLAIVSTNYLGRKKPADPGAAVYFTVGDEPRVMCCDRWDRVEDNLAAIAKTLNALRGIDRWGAATTSQLFTGFAALPAAGEGTGDAWWEVLGLGPDADELSVKRAFKEKARTAHPDRGGTREAWDQLNEANRQGLDATRSKSA